MTFVADTLLNDVARVLDDLDAQFAAPPSRDERRARMVHLVTEVCQREGRPYPTDAITAAVDRLLDQAPTAALTCTSSMTTTHRSWSRGVRALGQRSAALLQQGWRHLRTQGPVARTLSISALLGLGVAVIPWGGLIQAPFALAINHGGFFAGLWVFVVGLGVAGFRWIDRHVSDDFLAFMGFLGLGMSLVALGVGGIVARTWGTSLADVEQFQRDAPALQAVMTNARQQADPQASFAVVTQAALHALSDDRRVSGTARAAREDDTTGTLSLNYTFDQAECQEMMAHPQPGWAVVSVNGHPVTDPQHLSCAYHWENVVVIQNTQPLAPVVTRAAERPSVDQEAVARLNQQAALSEPRREPGMASAPQVVRVTLR